MLLGARMGRLKSAVATDCLQDMSFPLLGPSENIPRCQKILTLAVLQVSKQVLENAYLNSLKVMKENNLRSIAFPCISTGIYGYPSVSLFCKGEKVKDLLGSKSESGCLQELSGVRLHGCPAHGQILPGEEQGFC